MPMYHKGGTNHGTYMFFVENELILARKPNRIYFCKGNNEVKEGQSN